MKLFIFVDKLIMHVLNILIDIQTIPVLFCKATTIVMVPNFNLINGMSLLSLIDSSQSLHA